MDEVDDLPIVQILWLVLQKFKIELPSSLRLI